MGLCESPASEEVVIVMKDLALEAAPTGYTLRPQRHIEWAKRRLNMGSKADGQGDSSIEA